MVHVKNLKFYSQVKHESNYMRAKADVISRPNTSAMAKNMNFCILTIFLQIRPVVFSAYGWHRIAKFNMQERPIDRYLHTKFCEYISSRLGDIAKKRSFLVIFEKRTTSNPF